jgi:hypothetical protein
MSKPIKMGGPPYVPAAQGGLSDPRSSGPSAPSTRRAMLTDRRSTR